MIEIGIPTAMSAAETEALAQQAKGQLVLEMGSWQGYSTVILAKSASKVHSVDWHGGDHHAGYNNTLLVYFTKLLQHHVAHHVVSIVGRFEEVLPLLPRGHYDGCFLDGAHDEESVARDIALLLPVVRPEGWVAFHDYERQSTGFGVERGVARFHDRLMMQRLVDTLAIFKVLEERS